MSKQPTLFSFFKPSPKASNGSPSSAARSGSSSSPSSSASARRHDHVNGNSTPKTPKSSNNLASSSTPVSSRNGTGQKRRRTSGHSSDLACSSSTARKKIRNEDSSPNSTESFAQGSLVWALMEGYPWWPAMIRGVAKDGPVSRKNKKSLLEYHVQFFDNPTSRAWIRKGDMKPYIGSQDANIPPSKSNRDWVAACKVADEALSLEAEERIEKYWFDFEVDGEEENCNESDEDDKVMEISHEETPKARGKKSSPKKPKRIRQISTSEEENDDEAKEGKRKDAKRTPKAAKGNKSDDDEYSPTKDGSVEEESDGASASEPESEEMSEQEEDMESDDEERSRSRKKPKASSHGKSKTPSTPSSGIRNQLQRFNASDSPCASPKPSTSSNALSQVADVEKELPWEHLSFEWEKKEGRKDAKGRKETDPDYDPKTLYVPTDFLNKQTPGLRQWWDTKRNNFDTILFFKVGKFYEFYHWDACIAVKELGFTYMRQKNDDDRVAHAGFPEISFSRFANALIEKGYKIARIEQTETPSELEERVKRTRPSKFDKIIRREVCQISTKGVRYASFQDETVSNPFTSQSAYLYAIVEKQEKTSCSGPMFGVCFIDTTIGTFHLGQFQDDRHLSRLRTLFSHHVPAQILYEKGKLSANVQQLLFNMSSVRKDPLIPDSEFWGAKKVLKYLAEQDYLQDSDSGSTTNWPPSLQHMLSKSDHLGLTPDENWELGVKCLGGIVSYLKYCLLDHDLLSQKRFEIYKPVDSFIDRDNGNQSLSLPDRCFKPKYMVLDGITMRNLEILEGPLSLLSIVDKCGTNFGKRLLRHWLCLPLALPEEINERLDAVQELMDQRDCRSKIVLLLKTLPDLERILSKIHYLGSSHRSKNHPDGRANFFEEIKYSKNKIADLLATLRGFKACVNIMKELKRVQGDITSVSVLKLIDDFPEVEKLLTDFDDAFDHHKAAKDGKIIPKVGMIEEYDRTVKAIEDIKHDADVYLQQLSKKLGTRLSYFGSDKKRFQIEVPESCRIPTKEFEMSSSRKGFKRYYNSVTKGFLSSIMKAEAERDDVLRDSTRKIFEKFDLHRDTWRKVVECIGTLDVLISLSLFSESQEIMCRPSVSFASKPFINIVDGRHPCVASDSYIPNDTALGVENDDGSLKGNFVVLTGPNMGGKSTLMRQVGLLAILSHLGCFVPAEKCEMSVVDRIFTRLGANDNIGEGESTFYVEMSETSAILKHATADSLLLIDELGRGTATYDGTAIAYATAKELSSRNCRALFSTHYHTLVESLQEPSIQMTHMACMVENENDEDPTQESITFLYKMISGPCPKSYGFNAARLAGISDEVVRVAHKKAKEFENVVTGIRAFTSICSSIRNKTFSLEEFASLKI